VLTVQVWTLPRHLLDTSQTRLSHTPPDDSLTALPLPAAQGEPLYDLFVPINGSVEARVGQTSAKPRPSLGPVLFTPASGAGRRRGRLDAAAVPACRRGVAAREPAEPARRDARSSRDRAEIGPRSRVRRALASLRRRYSGDTSPSRMVKLSAAASPRSGRHCTAIPPRPSPDMPPDYTARFRSGTVSTTQAPARARDRGGRAGLVLRALAAARLLRAAAGGGQRLWVRDSADDCAHAQREAVSSRDLPGTF